jgi:HSP20 family protein
MEVIQKVKEIGSKVENSVKELGAELEKGAELVANKTTETFDNLASYIPFSNLAKKEDSVLRIEVDLPGVDKKDVNIQVEDGVLSVSAIRHYKNELTKDSYYLCESSFGKLQRRYSLPDNIDNEKIDAELKNGRLTIELHKTQEAKAKKISIK